MIFNALVPLEREQGGGNQQKKHHGSHNDKALVTFNEVLSSMGVDLEGDLSDKVGKA